MAKSFKVMNNIRSLLRNAVQHLRALHGYYLIRISGLFDEAWYRKEYPDVADAKINPLFHYIRYGGFEGRDPNPNFSSKQYLDTYNDVKVAGINPLVHFIKYRKKRWQPTFKKNNPNRKCDFFFIIGTGRSGTTLMAQVLNAHHKVCVPFELQIAFEYSNNGERLAEIFNSRKNIYFQAEDYIRLIEARCPNNFLEYYDYRAFFLQHHYPIHSLQQLLTELYTAIAYSQGKSMFGEQTPWYGQSIDQLRKIFPNAKFIHMVRDGRDVAISFARTPWWHKDINLNLERWNREVSKIEKDRQLLKPNHMLTVRYEDLVSTPEKVTKKVCKFLNITFEESMLDPKHHINYGQFSKLPDTGPITSSAYQNWQKEKKSAFFTDNKYGWKTNKDIDFKLINLPIQFTLKKFGYDV